MYSNDAHAKAFVEAFGEFGFQIPSAVAVTAYGRDENRRRAREAGFDLHLVKPVDPQVLLGRLQS